MYTSLRLRRLTNLEPAGELQLPRGREDLPLLTQIQEMPVTNPVRSYFGNS